MANASFSFVPTPSTLETRTGCRYLAMFRAKRPPKPPTLPKTSGRCVAARSCGKVDLTLFPNSISTPARAYALRFIGPEINEERRLVQSLAMGRTKWELWEGTPAWGFPWLPFTICYGTNLSKNRLCAGAFLLLSRSASISCWLRFGFRPLLRATPAHLRRLGTWHKQTPPAAAPTSCCVVSFSPGKKLNHPIIPPISPTCATSGALSRPSGTLSLLISTRSLLGDVQWNW